MLEDHHKITRDKNYHLQRTQALSALTQFSKYLWVAIMLWIVLLEPTGSFIMAEHAWRQVFESTMSTFTRNIKEPFIFDLDIIKTAIS